jgi:hypothetical protein
MADDQINDNRVLGYIAIGIFVLMLISSIAHYGFGIGTSFIDKNKRHASSGALEYRTTELRQARNRGPIPHTPERSLT